MAIKFYKNGNLKVTDLDETQSDIKFNDDESLECADFEEGGGDDGLVGYWKMDDNAESTTVLDVTGVNNGTFNDVGGNPNTSAHHETGKIGGALSFDGVNDYVTTGKNLVNGNTAFTVSTWAKARYMPVEGGTVNRVLVAHGSGDSGLVFLENYNRMYCYFNSMAVEIYVAFDDETDTNWHFWTCTISTTTDGKARIYKDSVLVGTSTASAESLTDTLNFNIGGDGANRHFNGTIDEVRIYNRALTAEEILLHFNNSKHRFYNTGKLSILGEIDET